MAIKMVAIDIDGTLINDNRQITPKTVAAIKKASQQGIKIVLCTGRPMTGVRAYLDQLSLANREDEYVVSFNGALAQTTSGNVMVDYSISFNDYADWVNYCLKEGVHSQIETRDYIYTTNQNLSYYTIYESELVSMLVRYRSLDEMARIQDQYTIAKAMMVDDKKKLIKPLRTFLKNLPTASQLCGVKTSTLNLCIRKPARARPWTGSAANWGLPPMK